MFIMSMIFLPSSKITIFMKMDDLLIDIKVWILDNLQTNCQKTLNKIFYIESILSSTQFRHFSAHQMGLLLEEDGIKFPQMETYEYSKLANVLHTKELARQLNGDIFKHF